LINFVNFANVHTATYYILYRVGVYNIKVVFDNDRTNGM